MGEPTLLTGNGKKLPPAHVLSLDSPMLNWIWMGMIVVGVVVAALPDQLTGANGIVEGMFSMIKIGVVNIVIPLSAIMMLWLGIMRLAVRV